MSSPVARSRRRTAPPTGGHVPEPPQVSASRRAPRGTAAGYDDTPLPFGVLLAPDLATDPLPQRRSIASARAGEGTAAHPHRRGSRGPGRTEGRDTAPASVHPVQRRPELRAGSPAAPAETAPGAGSRPHGSSSTGSSSTGSLPAVPATEDGPGDLFAPTYPIRAQRSRSPISQPGGLPLSRIGSSSRTGEWFTPAADTTDAAESAPTTSSHGTPASYPRRRDLRRQGATGPIPHVTGPLPRQDPAPGSAFVPDTDDTESTCPGPDRGSAAFPRRRDLRQTTRSDDREREGGREQEGGQEREGNGAVVAGVARAAVLTMLVSAGYVAVSGQHLDVAGLNGGDLFGRSGDSSSDGGGSAAAEAMVASGDPEHSLRASGWEVSSELREAKETGKKIEAAQAAAAKAAAERAAAERAAAKARAEAREEARARAMRDARRNPKAVAKILAAERGWTGQQFTCLDLLWTRESNWNYRATNPSSGAYGIPQSLPGSKMATVASDWRTNPITQIKWGLGYISSRYGTPCGAWAHSESTGWY